MPESSPCPDFRSYQSLAAGRLPAADKEVLLQHLELCDRCAQKAQSLPDADRLVQWIRELKGSSLAAEEPELTPLMKRLIQLGSRPGGPVSAGGSAGAARSQEKAGFLFGCPGCGKSLRIRPEAAGKKVKCPQCGQVSQAPVAAPGEHSTPAPLESRETVEVRSLESSLTTTGVPTVVKSSPGSPASQQQELCSFLGPAQAADELGRLGPYRVLQVLGAGGMGVVFRAEDPHLERLVALKAMLPKLAENESARQRFLREARAAARLKHDHVVTIHQVGEDRGAPFLAMEYLDGESLEDRLRREHKLPLPEVLRIGREIAEGLQAAHEQGLVHRDIKPGNVWLEGKRGRVKILDFGLARFNADDVHLTQSGAIVGTPAYMPPEQARGEKVDARCDLYSLGCVLYRLCTGELPFKGDNPMSLLMALAIEKPKSVREINALVPAALASLIDRLLAKDPADRPATAGEVIEALEAIDPGKPIARAAQPAAAPPRRRRRIAVALAGGALALAALLTVLVIHMRGPEEGTLTLETVDPDVELEFTSDGREYVVRDRKSGEEIKLPLGTYQVALKGNTKRLKLETNQLTVKRDGRELVRVSWQGDPRPGQAQGSTQPVQENTQRVQVVDLIELFQDADRVSVPSFTEKNQWHKAAGKLTYTSDGHSGKVMIPVSLKEVRDYEIDAQVRRLSGGSVFTFDLPLSATHQTGLDIFIGGRIELGLEGGRRERIGAWPAASGDSGHIVTHVHHDANGRDGSVTVTVDGQAAAKWTGELTTIGKPIEFRPDLPNERIPGLFCFQDSFEFSSWKLRILEGKAQILSHSAPVSPIQAPQPPPLAEWLKGRTVLTVAQDGSGQFKTIQAALDALQPGEVVKVLDRGPYRERLEMANLPPDSGLISEHETILELSQSKYIWTDPAVGDVFVGHFFRNADGFRLSGFGLLFPDSSLPQKAKIWQGLAVEHCDGLVLENCWIHGRCTAVPFSDSVSLKFCRREHWTSKSIVVRECYFEGNLLIPSLEEGGRVVIERNLFLHPAVGQLHVQGPASYKTIIIRHNVFGGPSREGDIWLGGIGRVDWLELSNNTLMSTIPSIIDGHIPRGVGIVRNNLHSRPGLLGLRHGAEKETTALQTWEVDHNAYPRQVAAEDGWKKENIFPTSPRDLLFRVKLLSVAWGDPDYMRIAADSPLALGGAGGAWPRYIGALPPGPAPKEGDWLTHLRQRWQTLSPERRRASSPSSSQR